MVLEVMFFLDTLHGGGTDPMGLSHQTDTPMGRVFGRAVQGGLNNLGFVFLRNLSWATGARSIFQNASQPLLFITSPCLSASCKPSAWSRWMILLLSWSNGFDSFVPWILCLTTGISWPATAAKPRCSSTA